MEFEKIGRYLDLIVIDVSFISLRLVFPKAIEFLKPGGDLVALVKPQFEASVGDVGKRGKVKDFKLQKKILEGLIEFAEEMKFVVMGHTKSCLLGKKSGNEEFFLNLRKNHN